MHKHLQTNNTTQRYGGNRELNTQHVGDTGDVERRTLPEEGEDLNSVGRSRDRDIDNEDYLNHLN